MNNKFTNIFITIHIIEKNKKQLILHEATPMEERLHEQLPPVVSIEELHNMCIPENQVNNKTVE